MVRRAHLVEHLGVVRERLEAVGESLGNVQAAPVVCGQLHRQPLQGGLRVRTHVDRHVEDRAACDAHQLRFFVRRCLVVQAAQRAPPTVV